MYNLPESALDLSAAKGARWEDSTGRNTTVPGQSRSLISRRAARAWSSESESIDVDLTSLSSARQSTRPRRQARPLHFYTSDTDASTVSERSSSSDAASGKGDSSSQDSSSSCSDSPDRSRTRSWPFASNCSPCGDADDVYRPTSFPNKCIIPSFDPA